MNHTYSLFWYKRKATRRYHDINDYYKLNITDSWQHYVHLLIYTTHMDTYLDIINLFIEILKIMEKFP